MPPAHPPCQCHSNKEEVEEQEEEEEEEEETQEESAGATGGVTLTSARAPLANPTTIVTPGGHVCSFIHFSIAYFQARN